MGLRYEQGGKIYGGGQILQPETIDRATTQTTDSRHNAFLTQDLSRTWRRFSTS